MQAQYNGWIVALSYLVAVFASFLALEMTARVAAAGRERGAGRYILPLAATAMGAGIWSMHFVGMLALRLPIATPYDPGATFLSLAFAIGASYVALHVVRAEQLDWRRLAAGGLVMGGGIVLMHYTGMAALQIMPRPTYDPALWALSAVIAIAAASAAMWICFQLKSGSSQKWKRIASALVMGLAIWGMHFTGMAAARFAPGSYCVGDPLTIDNSWLAGTVALSCLILFASLPLVAAINTRIARYDGIAIRRWSRKGYLVNGALLVILAVLTMLLFLHEDVPAEAAEFRHDAHELSEELKQSSDELTRTARLYAATGNPVFGRIYAQILDIYNGESPLPLDYDSSFWTRAAADPSFEPRYDATAPTQRQRLQQLGLTAQERTLLDQFERAMSVTTDIERSALDLLEGGSAGADQAAAGQALSLLHDATYLAAKVKVMIPLAQFQRSVEARAYEVERQADRHMDIILSLMLVALLLLLLSLGTTYLVTRRKVASLLLLEEDTRRLGESGFEFAAGSAGDEIGQLRQTFAAMHSKVVERTRALEHEVVERHRAEDESERFFNQSLNALLVAGFDGSYRRLNPVWEKTFGFTREYMFSRTFMDFVHEDDRATIAEAVGRIRQGGAVVAVECRCLCADGSYKIFAWNATPRGDGETFYATGHDVTALRAVERSLSLNEERFRHVVEAAPNGMVMANREGRIVLVNSQAEKMFGYHRDEMVGQPVELLMPERLRAAHPGHRRNFNAKPEARAMGGSSELAARRKDGSEFPVEIGISPIKGSEGMMVLSSIVDITERKRAERELRASEMQLHTIVENLAEGVVVSDMEGQLLHFNRAAVAMHGFTDMAECLMHLSEFPETFEVLTLDGKVCALEDWPLSRILRGGTVKDLEVRVRRRDRAGWQRVLIYSGSLVPGADGRPQLVVLTLSDVTERRRAEAERQQAQKLESVGRLAAGVAHEINSPVQFVNDCCHFVRDGVNDLGVLVGGYRQTLKALAGGSISGTAALSDIAQREQAADLDYLLENMAGAMERSLEGLQRVTAIVRSMKEFAHPDQKEKVHADLNAAITSTLTIARHEYKYVADVVTELGALPPVPCYLGDLNQAVLNLVVNAAHAIEETVRGSERKGLIRIATRLDGEEAVISIEDSGGGIPEDIQSRIFDPFFTTKGIGKGTGQGLAIARAVVVDMHRGRLEFETWPGKGTRFVIRLPLEAASAEAVAA